MGSVDGYFSLVAVTSFNQFDSRNMCFWLSGSNKVTKKYGVDQAVVTVVGYYFCDEPIPYRTTIAGNNVTLGQFKQHIAKKGNYRLVSSSSVYSH